MRVSDETELLRIPAEGTHAELDYGELLGRVLDLQVPDIVAVELERLPPRGARDSGHLEVDRHVIRRPDMFPQGLERGLEVGLGHVLEGESRRRRRL